MNSNSVDLIYLDPPFNKKKVFTAPIGSTAEGASFKDVFKEEDVKEEWIKTIAYKHPKIHSLIEGIKGLGNKYNWCYLVYMTMRLIECRSVLKDTGSLYLHCDPTMSHYLKLLLDCVFGEGNFRNEIVWHYPGGLKAVCKYFPKKSDVIFFYSKSENYKFNVQKRDKEYNSLWQRWGKFSVDGKTLLLKNFPQKDKVKLDMYTKRFISKNNRIPKPNDVIYEFEGAMIDNVWNDCPSVFRSTEKTGYPTQKPLKLLERIIKASTNEGDVVLDPFCGCATTCVAAEKFNRQWVGVDISEKAYDLVKERLKKEVKQDLLDWNKKIIPRTDIPSRTDLEKPKPHRHPDNVNKLWAEQDGKCNGCRLTGQSTPIIEKRNMHVDHILPTSKGGLDNIENLQLLCMNCNSSKHNKNMDEWVAFKKQQLKQKN